MKMGTASEDEKLILRQYREGDGGGLARLMANNFPVTEGYDTIKQTWLWQFKNNTLDEPYVMVAEDRGNLVAQYAVMGFRMNFMGGPIDVALSTSTVTDFNYRGRGLFPKLARLLYSHIKQRNCKLIYGFPNAQSIDIFLNKLSWFKIQKLPLLIKPINFKHILSEYIKNNILACTLGSFLNRMGEKLSKFPTIGENLKNITIKSTRYFPEETGGLWKMTHLRNRIALIRDNAYLEWRYLKKPQSKYDVNLVYEDNIPIGYLITKLQNNYGLNILFVMDIVIKDDDRKILSYVIDYISHQARMMGADILSMLVLNNHPHYSLFIKKGFLPIPETFFPQEIYFCAMSNSEDINVNSLQNKNNWYITWGDTDTI